MTDQIHAPWTPKQVAALNRFQAEGGMHPFTCGNDHATAALHLVAHEDGWHCWLPDCDYRQDWAHAFMADPGAWPKFPFSFEERERTGRNAGLVHPQDGPHAPQDGPQRPDAGAETPDGAGGRQTGADGRESLRDRLAEWLWDNCGEDERSGLLTDDPRKIATAVLRWPEIGEQPARTTVNNAATGGDAADNPLRERIVAAVRGCVEEGNIRYGRVTDAVLAVRDAELERLQARLDEAQQNALALDQGREELFAVIRGVRAAVHVTDDEDVTDWQRGYRACSERALAALNVKEQP